MAVKRLILALIAGVGLAAGFAPFELWPAPFLALGLLFHLLSKASLKERFLISLATGLAFFLPLLHWSSTYVGSIPWLILGIGQAAIFALIAIPRVKPGVSGVITFATTFLLIELLRSKFPFGGFGWGRVGFTQTDSLSFLYPSLGVAGLSLLIALVSAISLLNLRYLILSLLFVGASFLFQLQTDNKEAQAFKTTKVALVQGGVSALGFDFNNQPFDVLNRHVIASPKQFDGELIIWPENSVDIDPKGSETARQAINSVLQRNQDVFLLTGTVEQSKNGPRNSAVLYKNKVEPIAHYVKQDLAPFGEYIPWRTLAESISPYAAQVRDFIPGTKWQPFEVKDAKFQSFICFEILDDDHVRAGSKDMDFLVSQTNNATFGKSAQAAQQLQIIKARAAELNKEIAVVSTTGFSGLINNSGQLINEIPQFQPGSLEITINHRPGNSLASGLGTYFWVILAFLGLLTAQAERYLYRR